MAHGFVRGLALVATVGAVASQASAGTITDNSVANLSDVIGGYVALDLSSVIAVAPGTNSVTSVFNNGTLFAGTLTATVYGNVGTPGSSLTDIVVVYEFISTGGITPIETFEFGVDSGSNIDFLDIQNATQGTILNESTPGQASPFVTLNDNSLSLSNDTLLFDFTNGADTLAPGEKITWYMTSSANVALNYVDVNVTDFGGTLTQTIAFVTGTGQPDLNVPAPGAVALLAMGAGFASRRRRS